MSFFHNWTITGGGPKSADQVRLPKNSSETQILLDCTPRDQKVIPINFIDKNKKAEAIIVSSNMKDKNEFKKLFEELYPQHKNPSLVLSILGPNNIFPISISQKKAFDKGLIKVIDSKNDMLIITGIFFIYLKFCSNFFNIF
jgi:hypothetical protein